MKNRLRLILLEAIAILPFSSCRKDQGNGFCNEKRLHLMQIVQYGTMIPVADADVYLRRYAENSSALHVVKQLKSDEVGMVHWNCDEEIVEICASSPGYWDYCGSGYDIQMSSVVDGSYELLPKAWVRLSVVDEEPYDPTIHVFVNSQFDDTETVAEVMPHGFIDVLGCVGNSNEGIRIYKYHDQAEPPFFNKKISLEVLPFDTLNYTFTY